MLDLTTGNLRKRRSFLPRIALTSNGLSDHPRHSRRQKARQSMEFERRLHCPDTDLGNAFLAQQSGVMDAVQRMRRKAQDKALCSRYFFAAVEGGFSNFSNSAGIFVSSCFIKSLSPATSARITPLRSRNTRCGTYSGCGSIMEICR
jgi:hypothetical protein